MQINLGKQDVNKKTVKTAKRAAVIAAFVALSAVGAMIKIPGPLASVALDSAPGFFSALAFGGLEGMIVISMGHLLTAGMAGFYLTLPVHLAIAAEMALFALIFRFVNKKIGLIPAVIVGIVLNGVIAPFVLYPGGGIAAVVAAIPILTIGSAVNIIVAAVVYRSLKGTRLLK